MKEFDDAKTSDFEQILHRKMQNFLQRRCKNPPNYLILSNQEDCFASLARIRTETEGIKIPSATFTPRDHAVCKRRQRGPRGDTCTTAVG